MRAALALLFIAGTGVVAGIAPGAAQTVGFAHIDVATTPFPAFPVEPGSGVEFRGGLVLTSRARMFGSWSGLDFSTDGKTLYAIADDGRWLSMTLTETNGRLVGIDHAEMAPLLDDNGMPILRKVAADAEGLRIVRRGGVDTAYVSFEQVPDVRVFAGPDFSTARPRHLELPKALDDAPDNQGLEGIAIAPDNGPLAGAVVVIAEHFLDKAGNHRGFILDGPLPGAFTVRRSGAYDVSDAAFAPNGDLLILERKFAFPFGFSMRIRRIPAVSLKPGATLDGPIILEADGSTGIDNMEGMAVRGDPDGSVVITLISDDNQSFLERTVLLEFAVKAPSAMRPRIRAVPAATTAAQ